MAPEEKYHLKVKLAKITVLAYSGYCLNERPVRFYYRGKIHEIQEILGRTLEDVQPGNERIYTFRVRCRDGKIFLLVNFPALNQWFVSQGSKWRSG
jgi:hypothetical protein